MASTRAPMNARARSPSRMRPGADLPPKGSSGGPAAGGVGALPRLFRRRLVATEVAAEGFEAGTRRGEPLGLPSRPEGDAAGVLDCPVAGGPEGVAEPLPVLRHEADELLAREHPPAGPR